MSQTPEAPPTTKPDQKLETSEHSSLHETIYIHRPQWDVEPESHEWRTDYINLLRQVSRGILVVKPSERSDVYEIQEVDVADDNYTLVHLDGSQIRSDQIRSDQIRYFPLQS